MRVLLGRSDRRCQNFRKRKKERKIKMKITTTHTDKRGREGRETRSRQDNVGQQRIIPTALSSVKSMAARAPGESGAELSYLWPLNAASSATIRFLPPPHVTEGTPPSSFYLYCGGAFWEMRSCVHLRCPWATNHYCLSRPCRSVEKYPIPPTPIPLSVFLSFFFYYFSMAIIDGFCFV